MKKTLISLALGLSTMLGVAGTFNGFTGSPATTAVSVNVVAGTPFLLSTNNVTIQNVAIITSTNGFVSFFDCGNTNAPYYGTNYVVGTNVTWANIPTNWVTTYVGYNGWTNYYTNSGVWTTYTTNLPSTNALPYQGSFAAINGVVGTYSSTMSFQQGVSILSTVNATLIINYLGNH